MIFPHALAPADKTVQQHIIDSTDWEERVRAVGQQFAPHAQVKGLYFDAKALAKEIAQFYREAGNVQWRSQVNTSISGASLSIDHTAPSESWISGSFGHERYRESKNYYAAVSADQANRVKGDYLDTLSFRRLHPAVHRHCPQLAALLRRFKAPVARVTVRTISGHLCAPSHLPGNTGGYHTDDSPFELLRVNMAIDNDGSFGLQYKDGPVLSMYEGNHAIVNTDRLHRVHVKDHTLKARTHIIVGLAPWLHYDPRLDSWELNEHAGIIHPYDMAESGLLF